MIELHSIAQSQVSQISDACLRLSTHLGWKLRQPDLLEQALTHPSIAKITHERLVDIKGWDFERLEFLGDRILGLVVAELLLERFPFESEGDIACRHAELVRRTSLEQVADEIDLGRFVRLAPQTQARDRKAILADALEALIAAYYLDQGLAAASQFIRHYWKPLLQAYAAPPKDNKSYLQEWAQGRGLALPYYRVTACEGPAHAPRFRCRVIVNEALSAEGEGKSKRLAEQQAAAVLLVQLRKQGELSYDNGDYVFE